MSIVDDAERLMSEGLRPLRMKLGNMLRRAVVDRVNDGKKQGEIQARVLADDPQDQIENFEHYGFTTWLRAGAELVVARIGGSGDHQIAIASADRAVRPKLEAEGDVTIWDCDGQKVELKRAKIVVTVRDGNVLELGAGATAGVGRVGDQVSVTIPIGTVVTAASGAVLNAAPITLTGTIDEGSTVVLATD
jgi:phage gp45-like